MAILELVRSHPDWPGALGVALTRPPGTPERRGGQDHWNPDTAGRPRRISDDLAWFRDAVDEPELHVNLLRHGRRTCHARRPACETCALRRMGPGRIA